MLTSTADDVDVDVAVSRAQFHSDDWRTIVLHRPMRASNDEPFARFLDHLRAGACVNDDLNLVNSRRVATINDARVLALIDDGARIVVPHNNQRDVINLIAARRWAASRELPLTFYSSFDTRAPLVRSAAITTCCRSTTTTTTAL